MREGEAMAGAPASRPSSTSLAQALGGLWELKERGAITQAEFDGEKARLLGTPTTPFS
jgi:hypothetical protein